MSKINLLPWREELRKIQNRVFFALSGATVFLSVMVVYSVGLILDTRIDTEGSNIDYLNNEIKSIKAEVTQIQGLQLNKKQLLNRMNVIQELQAERFSIVKLLDMLPRITPEGIYLTAVSRTEIEGGVAQTGTLPSGTIEPQVGVEKSKEIEILKKEYHVTLQGVAQTNGSISILLKNLEDLHWLSEVRLSEVSINKNGQGLNFKVDFIQKLSDGG